MTTLAVRPRRPNHRGGPLVTEVLEGAGLASPDLGDAEPETCRDLGPGARDGVVVEAEAIPQETRVELTQRVERVMERAGIGGHRLGDITERKQQRPWWLAHRSVDPGPGEADQPSAAGGIEAVHRPDEGGRAVLDGVVEVFGLHATTQGVEHHPAESGLDQRLACARIAAAAAEEELPLLLGGQRRRFESAASIGRHVHTVPAIEGSVIRPRPPLWTAGVTLRS